MDYFLSRRLNGSGISGAPIPYFLTFDIATAGAVGATGKEQGVPGTCVSSLAGFAKAMREGFENELHPLRAPERV